jgi:hypothetical protein
VATRNRRFYREFNVLLHPLRPASVHQRRLRAALSCKVW